MALEEYGGGALRQHKYEYNIIMHAAGIFSKPLPPVNATRPVAIQQLYNGEKNKTVSQRLIRTINITVVGCIAGIIDLWFTRGREKIDGLHSPDNAR